MDLIDLVMEKYNDYPSYKINRVWGLTHMQIMNKILKTHADNTFKMHHMNKDKLLKREGRLPMVLEVDTDDMKNALEGPPATTSRA